MRSDDRCGTEANFIYQIKATALCLEDRCDNYATNYLEGCIGITATVMTHGMRIEAQ